MSKTRLNEHPEKDLTPVQTVHIGQNHHRAFSAQPTATSSLNSQGLSLNRETFYAHLPETSRLMSQFNPQLSPYMYERMTSTMNQMNINDKFYNPSMSHIGNQSAESINETTLRRDNELDRLRMRLLLLEQQQPTQNHMNVSDPIQMRYKNFELEAAYLRNQFTSYNNSKTKITELENLLNQREFEIQELKKKFSDESQQIEKEIVQCRNLANDKEEKLIMEKNRSSTLQKEIDRLNSKLNECNRYISELPTKDEIKQNEEKFEKLESENEALRQKLADFEKRHAKAKQFIRDKNQELTEHKDKMEKLELEKEKVNLEFQNYKMETQSVGELIERCKENASLKADLEISHKFIVKLQEKINTIECEFKQENSELSKNLEEKENNLSQLNEENELKEKKLIEANKMLKQLSWQQKTLEQENATLTQKINSLETSLSSEALKLMKILFKELNLTIKDLDMIVTCCIDIYHGNQVDICSLLGTAKQCSADVLNLDKNETILNVVNKENIEKNIQNTRDIRKKLENVKQMITSEYAEKIGNNISCMMQ